MARCVRNNLNQKEIYKLNNNLTLDICEFYTDQVNFRTKAPMLNC